MPESIRDYDAPVTDPADKPHLKVSVHGPAVTIEDAIQAGAATKDLLRAVGREMGHPDLSWQVVAVEFQCDRCGLRRPDRPGPDEGWKYREGDDLCPDCAADETGSQ